VALNESSAAGLVRMFQEGEAHKFEVLTMIVSKLLTKKLLKR
jgi:preprotein translocase subunit Sec61beta